MLSPREVRHIAKLARIGLSDEELLKFQKELSSVLQYFEILRELDVSSTEPMTHAVLLQDVTRKDTAIAKPSSGALRLLQMAPAVKGGYLKVKSIL